MIVGGVADSHSSDSNSNSFHQFPRVELSRDPLVCTP